MLPYGAKPTNQYLAQRISGASPEELTVLLLEGAQRFLTQAMAAIKQKDIPGKARLVNKVSAIIEELAVGLNYEDGGELVLNLARIYEWWLSELFDASIKNQHERLALLHHQMGELRSSWEQVIRQRPAAADVPAFTAEGLVG